MKKLKKVVSRFFILFACIGFVISFNSCALDEKDKDLESIQTYLETYDRTTWTVIEQDMRIFLRINIDKDKDFEIWMSELELAKLIADKECFYYSEETLDTEEVVILENSESKLRFKYRENETWTFSMDGEQLKLELVTSDNIKKAVYFSKTKENVDALDICSKERSQGAFDWKFLK